MLPKLWCHHFSWCCHTGELRANLMPLTDSPTEDIWAISETVMGIRNTILGNSITEDSGVSRGCGEVITIPTNAHLSGFAHKTATSPSFVIQTRHLSISPTGHTNSGAVSLFFKLWLITTSLSHIQVPRTAEWTRNHLTEHTIFSGPEFSL